MLLELKPTLTKQEPALYYPFLSPTLLTKYPPSSFPRLQ
jgi:hypothetical protein